MIEITYLEYADFKIYNPIFVLNEDLLYDNCFCILNTDLGNIVFSYHNTGIKPGAVIHDNQIIVIYENGEKKMVSYENGSLKDIDEIKP